METPADHKAGKCPGRALVLAVMVTQLDVFNRLLGTAQINLRQFGWALIPALALLLLRELGKYVARRWARS
jgi:Ca2+-transporting ATPase